MMMKTGFLTIPALLMATQLHAGDPEVANPMIDSPAWTELAGDLAGEGPILDAEGVFTLEAPPRAHDAATVPITLHQTVASAEPIRKARLIVDENPAPVVADIEFGPAMAPVDFEMRVRVNQYSNVRAIVETDDARYMDGRFVKASGGCSAPATRATEDALAAMGQMKLKSFGAPGEVSTPRREAQIMIRHPNYSGLQRDQITQLFVPAHFINSIEVFQGDDRLFLLEGGISLSENPVFRFSYADNGSETLRVLAKDTEGNSFEQVLSKAGT
jgi:sulfur-oxidizing protein SoxY